MEFNVKISKYSSGRRLSHGERLEKSCNPFESMVDLG